MQFFFSTICWQALVVIHNGYIIIPSRTGKYHPLYTLNNLGFFIAQMVSILGQSGTLKHCQLTNKNRRLPGNPPGWSGCEIRWSRCHPDFWAQGFPAKNSSQIPSKVFQVLTQQSQPWEWKSTKEEKPGVFGGMRQHECCVHWSFPCPINVGWNCVNSGLVQAP